MRIRHYLLLLFTLGFLTYLSSFGNQFVWDDEQFIYKNTYIVNFQIDKIFTQSTTAGAGSPSDYYRPFTSLSFAIDTSIWGLNPLPFHIVNTLLHIAAGSCIFLLLLKLKLPKMFAFAIALVFLVHPLQTESVTYINSRGDSLYVLFGMLSALALSKLFDKKTVSFQIYNLELAVTKLQLTVFTILFYAASILSKEIGIAVLGILVILYVRTLLTSGLKTLSFIKQHRYANAAVIGLIVVCIVYLILRGSVLNFYNSFNLFDDGSLYSESLLVRLLTFSKVIWIYIRLIFIPYPLFMERSTSLVTSLASVWPWASISLFLSIVYLAWREYNTTNKLRIAVGGLWFFGMLVPVSGIIPINGILYEHWLYLPIVGFLILLYGVSSYLFSERVKKFLRSYWYYIFVPIVLLYMSLTIRQNYYWSTPIRLYEYLLQHTSSARIHSNLGMAYADQGNFEQAITNYKKSLDYSDKYPQTYHNLANSYQHLGEYKLAIENYNAALAIQPTFAFSYQPLITALIHEKRYEEALQRVEQIKLQWPNEPYSYLFEIAIYVDQQDFDKAEETYTQLESTFPNNTQQLQLARSLITTGN